MYAEQTLKYARPVTPARQIVLDFLTARLEANNARLAFLADNTPEALKNWVDWEEKAQGDTPAEFE